MTTQIQVPESAAAVVPEIDDHSPRTVTYTVPATHNYRAVQVIWLVAGIITALLAIRFTLKLLGASLQSGFVTFTYSLTDLFVAPFRAIFAVSSGQAATVDVAALVAIVVYALAGWGLVAIVKVITAPRGARSVS